jgi:hypothetical protein
VALLGAAALTCAMALVGVYLPRCARDGGQREILAAYYRERTRGPLVAYQLNWKGENFYTGNDVAIFISSGSPMKAWLDGRHGEPLYFVAEKVRVPSLKNELQAREFTELTSNAEYALVRAVL